MSPAQGFRLYKWFLFCCPYFVEQLHKVILNQVAGLPFSLLFSAHSLQEVAQRSCRWPLLGSVQEQAG